MLLTKEKKSVTKAILSIWGDVPETFHLNEISKKVRKLTGRSHESTTISAKLRLLRSKNKIGFICIDYKTSLYRKLF